MRQSTPINSSHYLVFSGQSLAEYSLVLGLVSIALISSLTMLGQNLNDSANEVNTNLVAFGNSLSGNGNGTSVVAAGAGHINPVQLNNNTNAQDTNTTQGTTNTTGNNIAPTSNTGNILATQNVCIRPSLCFNIPTPGQGGEKVSDVVGDMGQELIQQYAQTMDQVLAQLRQEDPTLLNEFPELVELANRGHRMSDVLTQLDAYCRNNGMSSCSSTDLPSQSNQHSGYGQGNTQQGPQIDNPVQVREDFQRQVLVVRDLFNGALNNRLSGPSKNLIKLMSQQINNIHKGAISSYGETQAEGTANNSGRPLADLWDLPSVPIYSSTTYALKSANDAPLITINSNTICGVGTNNTSNCS